MAQPHSQATLSTAAAAPVAAAPSGSLRAKQTGGVSTAAQPEAKAPAADKPAVKAPAAPAQQTTATPAQQQQQQSMPDDVSIFSVQKIRTADGKVEVVVKPLPALTTAAPHSNSNLNSLVSTAALASSSDLAAGANAASPALSATSAAAPKACAKPETSSHEADIVFTAGQNGLSQTTLSASCAAAAPALSTLGGGCSLRCDFEEDLAKITLVGMRNMTAAAGSKGTADKPAVCRCAGGI
jgi:hypothetical protein